MGIKSEGDLRGESILDEPTGLTEASAVQEDFPASPTLAAPFLSSSSPTTP